MTPEHETTLVILAGGKGSRLGADKSRIRIAGQPILSYLLDRLQWNGPTLLIKSRADLTLGGEDRFDHVLADLYPHEGPLGGIVTAITAKRNRMIILPIDLPNLGRDYLLGLLDLSILAHIVCYSRTTATQDVVWEPFPMRIDGSAAEVICAHFQSGARSLRSLLKLDCSQVLLPRANSHESDWLNINFPEDLIVLNAHIDGIDR